MEMTYASNAKGNLGVALGAVGTALGSGIINGGLGGMFNAGTQYVNKEAYEVQLQLIEANKENAILTADLASEKKMVEVYNGATARINAVRDELNDRIYKLETTVANNAASQAVINCGFQSNVGILQTQVAQLMGMTKTVIPNANICPGWDNASP